MATIRIEDDGAVRVITLDRPERRNALNPAMQDELTAAFREVNDSTARVLVLQGAGEGFCAGLDIAVLREMSKQTAEQQRVEAQRTATMFRALYEVDVPTISLVRGAAIAGGTGLATICDFTLAAPDARFGYTEVKIGFVPALVSAYLAQQVGDKVARGLLLSARLFGAEEAHRIGLVSEVVSAAGMEARGQALAQELLANAPESLRATKKLLRAQRREWLDAALELAMEANAASRLTANFREGVASFVEKRKPDWTGR